MLDADEAAACRKWRFQAFVNHLLFGQPYVAQSVRPQSGTSEDEPYEALCRSIAGVGTPTIGFEPDTVLHGTTAAPCVESLRFILRRMHGWEDADDDSFGHRLVHFVHQVATAVAQVTALPRPTLIDAAAALLDGEEPDDLARGAVTLFTAAVSGDDAELDAFAQVEKSRVWVRAFVELWDALEPIMDGASVKLPDGLSLSGAARFAVIFGRNDDRVASEAAYVMAASTDLDAMLRVAVDVALNGSWSAAGAVVTHHAMASAALLDDPTNSELGDLPQLFVDAATNLSPNTVPWAFVCRILTAAQHDACRASFTTEQLATLPLTLIARAAVASATRRGATPEDARRTLRDFFQSTAFGDVAPLVGSECYLNPESRRRFADATYAAKWTSQDHAAWLADVVSATTARGRVAEWLRGLSAAVSALAPCVQDAAAHRMPWAVRFGDANARHVVPPSDDTFDAVRSAWRTVAGLQDMVEFRAHVALPQLAALDAAAVAAAFEKDVAVGDASTNLSGAFASLSATLARLSELNAASCTKCADAAVRYIAEAVINAHLGDSVTWPRDAVAVAVKLLVSSAASFASPSARWFLEEVQIRAELDLDGLSTSPLTAPPEAILRAAVEGKAAALPRLLSVLFEFVSDASVPHPDVEHAFLSTSSAGATVASALGPDALFAVAPTATLRGAVDIGSVPAAVQLDAAAADMPVQSFLEQLIIGAAPADRAEPSGVAADVLSRVDALAKLLQTTDDDVLQRSAYEVLPCDSIEAEQRWLVVAISHSLVCGPRGDAALRVVASLHTALTSRADPAQQGPALAASCAALALAAGARAQDVARQRWVAESPAAPLVEEWVRRAEASGSSDLQLVVHQWAFAAGEAVRLCAASEFTADNIASLERIVREYPSVLTDDTRQALLLAVLRALGAADEAPAWRDTAVELISRLAFQLRDATTLLQVVALSPESRVFRGCVPYAEQRVLLTCAAAAATGADDALLSAISDELDACIDVTARARDAGIELPTPLPFDSFRHDDLRRLARLFTDGAAASLGAVFLRLCDKYCAASMHGAIVDLTVELHCKCVARAACAGRRPEHSAVKALRAAAAVFNDAAATAPTQGGDGSTIVARVFKALVANSYDQFDVLRDIPVMKRLAHAAAATDAWQRALGDTTFFRRAVLSLSVLGVKCSDVERALLVDRFPLRDFVAAPRQIVENLLRSGALSLVRAACTEIKDLECDDLLCTYAGAMLNVAAILDPDVIEPCTEAPFADVRVDLHPGDDEATQDALRRSFNFPTAPDVAAAATVLGLCRDTAVARGWVEAYCVDLFDMLATLNTNAVAQLLVVEVVLRLVTFAVDKLVPPCDAASSESLCRLRSVSTLARVLIVHGHSIDCRFADVREWTDVSASSLDSMDSCCLLALAGSNGAVDTIRDCAADALRMAADPSDATVALCAGAAIPSIVQALETEPVAHTADVKRHRELRYAVLRRLVDEYGDCTLTCGFAMRHGDVPTAVRAAIAGGMDPDQFAASIVHKCTTPPQVRAVRTVLAVHDRTLVSVRSYYAAVVRHLRAHGNPRDVYDWQSWMKDFAEAAQTAEQIARGAADHAEAARFMSNAERDLALAKTQLSAEEYAAASPEDLPTEGSVVLLPSKMSFGEIQQKLAVFRVEASLQQFRRGTAHDATLSLFRTGADDVMKLLLRIGSHDAIRLAFNVATALRISISGAAVALIEGFQKNSDVADTLGAFVTTNMAVDADVRDEILASLCAYHVRSTRNKGKAELLIPAMSSVVTRHRLRALFAVGRVNDAYVAAGSDPELLRVVLKLCDERTLWSMAGVAPPTVSHVDETVRNALARR